MTDKQIIIDGVDVSECDFLAKEDDYCSYSGITYAYKGQCGCSDEEMCKDHPNCFYKKALKQLKRKEQECEELKETIQLQNKMQMEVCEEKNTEIDQLKAENEVLEKVNKSNQEKIKKLNEQLEEEFINHQYGEEALFFEMEDYKQAIEKIKEIANRTCSAVNVEVCDSYDSCADCGATNQYRKLMQILQICDEVNE